MAEAHAERVHPEVVEPLGVAGGDVAGDALLEAELAEEPEAGGEALLAVQALLLDGLVLREVPAVVVGQRSRPWNHLVLQDVVEPSEAVAQGRNAAEPVELDHVAVVGDERPVAPPRPRAARAPSAAPATNAALASTSARHASPATTVTDARPDVGGRARARIDEVVQRPPAARPRSDAAGCWWRSRPRRARAVPVRPVPSGSSTSTTQPCGGGASPRARRSPPRFTSTPVTPGSPASRSSRRHLVGRRALADAAEVERHAGREAHRPHEVVELDVAAARGGRGVPSRRVVLAGAGDRVEVAVVAGGLERGEHGRVVATAGVAPRVDRARDERERALPTRRPARPRRR